MMPTIINEGSLRFTFPDGWLTLQYDATAFYRKNIPTDIGMAAVDFIACPDADNTKIVLIEVKDFRGHAAEARKRQASGDLVKEVIKKAIDTLAGFYIAVYTANPELAGFVRNELLPPSAIELILFMEEDAINGLSKIEQQNYKVRFGDISLKLKRIKSQLKINATVLNTTLLKTRHGFIVVHI